MTAGLLLGEFIHMARKAKAEKDDRFFPSKGGNNFKGFVRHNLSVDEKASYDTWAETYTDFWMDVERLVDSGYKFSVAYDGYNKTVQAMLTCNDEKNPDFGWVLAARAPSPSEAMSLLMFKHFVLLHGSWIEFIAAMPGSDRSWG